MLFDLRRIEFLITVLILILAVFFAPLVSFTATSPLTIESDLSRVGYADAAVIVFGDTVYNDIYSPIIKERLDTALYLHEKGLVGSIVVSNIGEETYEMKNYLVENGVPPEIIELDAAAETTLDTCKTELKKFPEGRTVIFLSQGYSLPRLIEQCRRIGVAGTALAVEQITPVKREVNSLSDRAIKAYRLIREAALSWPVAVKSYE